jgi:hypothetical protein
MALVWISISMILLIAVVGLALDTGYVVAVGGQMQHAADAAALAGAQTVYQEPLTVKNTAVTIGSSNLVANQPLVIDPTNDVTVGTYNTSTKTFTAGGLAPNAVQVVAKRTGATSGAIPLFFGAVFGTSNVDMTRTATAMIAGSGNGTMVVLDPNATCALTVSGGTNLTVIGGPIQVNSRQNRAACFGGNSQSFADAINTVGGSSLNTNAVVDAILNQNQPAVPDPLASLPAPTFPAGQAGVDVGPGTTQTLSAGYYTTGISVRGTAILNPGIYIVGKPGLKVNSGANLTGDGVMIYVADGSFDSSSTGANTHLTPPDPAVQSFPGVTTYAGIVVFQARSDSNTSSISLNGSLTIHGTMYFPAAEFDVSSGGSEFGVRLIANQVKVTGIGNVRINSRANGYTDGKPFLVK